LVVLIIISDRGAVKIWVGFPDAMNVGADAGVIAWKSKV